jgi:hypothetical protein
LRAVYQRHKECEPLHDDAVLWRYMDLTRFIAMLESSSLASTVEDTADAWEEVLTQVGPAQKEVRPIP